MGRALPRGEASDRLAIRPELERAAEEHRLASIAYLAWPVALYDRVSPRADASQWYRFHLRQAFWFGNIAAAITLAAFVWPLLLSFFFSAIGAIIWIYALAFVADIALFVLWLVLAMRYSRRAAAGELFDVPWVARLKGPNPKTP